MSDADPEVLFGSNQRPERVSIPPFHLLQERTDIKPATLSSWLKQTILLCYKQAEQQALDFVQVKAHDFRGLEGLLRWGIGGPNHASLSLESSQHIYKFLPKIPYLVRQRQQYVPGTSVGGTTSPRSFPSDQVSPVRKDGGTQPSLQESNPRV